LIDSTGLVVQDIDPNNIGKSEIGQEYFLETMLSGYPTVSNIYFDEAAGLFIAAPVRTNRGEIIGLLRVRYDARVLQAILLRERKTDALALNSALLDDAYYIRLADSHSPESNYKSFAPLNEAQVKMLQNSRRLPGGESTEFAGNEPEVVEGILASKNTPIFTAPAEVFDGEPAMVAVRHLDEAPWIVMVRQAVREVQVPVETQTRLAVVLSLAALALIAGVAFLVSQALSAPLMHLKQVAEQVAAGDLRAQAKISTPDEVGLLASTFNTMTQELRSTLDGLEQRVADRTRAIKLSAEVGRRLSTILNPSQLVTEVVQLLQQAFNYYHVHIYLFDEQKANLVMMGGTGEAGRIMLERRHQIPLGKGLVGRAAETGTAVLAADTSQEPDWLPNPLLPDTRAEIAVPILLGDEVLGVLDVQQNSVYGLGRDDMELLYGIAAQVAIALRNAEQYTQAQRRAQREALTSQIVQQIQSTRSVERALQITVRELGRALGMERTRVRIAMGQDNHAENSGNGKSTHE
jgi:putative methionine-R-sulfoxide reductase with GAF domain